MADDSAVSVPLTPVESSQIDAVGWENGKLFVKFRRGGMYVYSDVSYGLFQELMASDSKGKFLGQEIKGRFQYERVE